MQYQKTKLIKKWLEDLNRQFSKEDIQTPKEDKQAHEKMFSIVNPQRNANQNEISLHTCENGYYQKQITNVGKNVEKREPSTLLLVM